MKHSETANNKKKTNESPETIRGNIKTKCNKTTKSIFQKIDIGPGTNRFERMKAKDRTKNIQEKGNNERRKEKKTTIIQVTICLDVELKMIDAMYFMPHNE